jgi:predicted MFS family arabinose efflux permease
MNNVRILLLAQFLGACSQVVNVLLGGLVGAALAPDPRLATLPLTFATVGIALATLPMAPLTVRFGRRPTLVLGALVAAIGTLLAALAISRQDFWLYCAGTALVGANTAFLAQFRFAAAESVEEHAVSRAVALIMLGTVGAALLAPWLVTELRGTGGAEYVGSYLALTLTCVLSAAALLGFRQRRSQLTPASPDRRPLGEITREPRLRLAVSSAAVAYGVMALVMTATPLSMHVMDGHSVASTTLVLQSHVLAMYLPSLFSGALVARFGIGPVLGAGLLLETGCMTVALLGHELMHYWTGLVALGLGWNLMFVAATTLLTRSYRPGEGYQVQSLNDFLMFGVMGSASATAGLLISTVGWPGLNGIALLPLLLLGAALLRWRSVLRH